ncbi:MAG: hypothetical protein BWY50_02167 [Spirochaetes bacterium ADurb.Bin315]|nr:MAG: hypothetical protein BWY50_02167 [Spirochaetes bacterium ADurb.Bin315]
MKLPILVQRGDQDKAEVVDRKEDDEDAPDPVKELQVVAEEPADRSRSRPEGDEENREAQNEGERVGQENPFALFTIGDASRQIGKIEGENR